jgi:hypothetical protein
VIRFIDQMRDITDRVLFGDYSAERFVFGRVATELDAAATRDETGRARWLDHHSRGTQVDSLASHSAGKGEKSWRRDGVELQPSVFRCAGPSAASISTPAPEFQDQLT